MRSTIAFSMLAAAGLFAACSDDASESAPPPPAVDAGKDSAVAPPTLCPGGVPADWPPGPYGVGVTETLPKDLVFEGGVRIADFFEPCAPQSKVLIVRSTAGFCGPCEWHAQNTDAFLADPRAKGRAALVELLVSDEDNMPPTPAALERWRQRGKLKVKVGLDPKYTFAASLLAFQPLPTYVLVDVRTMRVLGSMGNPDPDRLLNRVELELALADGAPRPTPAAPELFDQVFTADQMATIRGMKLVAAPPPDPTNEVADNPAAAALGKQLFADTSLSPSGTVSCATCHIAEKTYTDGVPQSTGVAKVDRNSPSIALAAHARWQFWDGRADTLWAQALGPPENDKEMASSRLFVVRAVAQKYQAAYDAVFTKTPLPDLSGLPQSGKPGDPAWEAMAPADKDAVTRAYVNVGKAIAAFERSLRVKPSRLDRYVDGDLGALTAQQKSALHSFLTVGCAQCHWGPRLTDDAFHAIRMPTGRADKQPDRGRFDVLPGLAKAEFNAASKWSDAPSAAKLLVFAPEATMLGAFKTPSLRAVAATAPYGHGGSLATLLDVVRHYGTRGGNVRDEAIGVAEPWLGNFDENVVKSMVNVFDAFDAEVLP